MKTIRIKECCAICEHLYDKSNCPLYAVYNMAATCGEDAFEEKAKYKVFCEGFELSSKFEAIEE